MTDAAVSDPRVSDHWLDEVTEPAEPVFDRATHRAFAWISGPARFVRRSFSFLGTTPGKLTAMMVLLTAAIVAAGMSMATFSDQRHARLEVLLASTEPMNNAAHNLYTNLSLADTVASTGFVQAGVEPQAARTRYNEAVDQAAISATQAVFGTDAADARIRELITQVQRSLPVYTALVEAARTNRRADNAVAATYMTNASALMREEILPAAGELFQLTSDKLARQQRELTTPQWVPISGFVAAIALLLAAQWWLWRLTRRRFNRGFLTATGLLTVALAWVVTANWLTWAAGAQRFDAAAVPWEGLTDAQISAQQARTSETLVLITRQASESAAADFASMAGAVDAALDAYAAADPDDGAGAADTTRAREAIGQWQVAHAAVLEDLSAGRYDAAVEQATAARPGSSQESFNQLNESLDALIGSTREAMRSYIHDSLNANRALGGAVGLLTIGSIIAVWAGIRPRLQEYL